MKENKFTIPCPCCGINEKAFTDLKDEIKNLKINNDKNGEKGHLNSVVYMDDEKHNIILVYKVSCFKDSNHTVIIGTFNDYEKATKFIDEKNSTLDERIEKFNKGDGSDWFELNLYQYFGRIISNLDSMY